MIKIKLMCLIITLGYTGLNATVWSQEKRINLKSNQVNLVQLFQQMQKKTELKFVFNHEDVQGYTCHSDITGKTVKEILDIETLGRPHGPRRDAGPHGRCRDARGQVFAGVHALRHGRAVHHVRRGDRMGAGEPRGVGRRRSQEGLPGVTPRRCSTPGRPWRGGCSGRSARS